MNYKVSPQKEQSSTEWLLTAARHLGQANLLLVRSRNPVALTISKLLAPWVRTVEGLAKPNSPASSLPAPCSTAEHPIVSHETQPVFVEGGR